MIIQRIKTHIHFIYAKNRFNFVFKLKGNVDYIGRSLREKGLKTKYNHLSFKTEDDYFKYEFFFRDYGKFEYNELAVVNAHFKNKEMCQKKYRNVG